MTLPLRRALALLFTGLFMLVALASIAYGRGYRFDFKTRHIRLTGVILLAGVPDRVQVTIDSGARRSVSLPTTFRGLLPTTHTFSVVAPGYRNQVFTVNVRSGQTTFATDLQLYRENPFTTVKTGIPKDALLAPDGSAVAWLEERTLTIATSTSANNLAVAKNVSSISWSEGSENIFLHDVENATLATVSSTGVRRETSYVLPAGNRPKITPLLNGRMVYRAAQTIPGSTSWLLLDESSAWILQPSGDLTLATRWGNQIIGAMHLGRQSLATVRREEVLVRNLANSQTTLYEIPHITQASAGLNEGELNVLVADGDLLQWQRGQVF